MMKMQVKNCIGTRKRKRKRGEEKQQTMVHGSQGTLEPFRLKLKQAKEERSVRKGEEEGKAARGSDK